jgi:hypothetical protein
MATANANHAPDLPIYVIRPALVEARLITQKHACDTVYVATLAEELRNIEAKIAAAEECLKLGCLTASSQYRSCRTPKDRPDADWLREKSSELDLRLRRIERSSKQP